MFGIYLMGVAIIALLAGSFSYVLNIIEIIIIGAFGFGVHYFIFSKRKVFWWTTGILFLLSTGLFVYLYKTKTIDIVLLQVKNFLLPYYYSVTMDDFYIGVTHQRVMLFLLSLIVFRFVGFFYQTKALKSLPIVLGVAIIIPAYQLHVLSNYFDRYAFYIYIVASFVYFFELRFVKNRQSKGEKKRRSFYQLGVLLALVLLGLSIIAHSTFANPFQIRKKTLWVSNGENTQEFQLPESQRKQYLLSASDTFEVQTAFLHEGIEVFKAKADKLKYYISQTYNTYESGTWRNESEEEFPMVSPIVNDLNTLDDTAFFTENIVLVYRNIRTDSLIIAPFTTELDFGEKENSIERLHDGTYKMNEEETTGFNYKFVAIIPKYGTRALQDYMTDQEADGLDYSQYLQVPLGYERLERLSDSITEGLDSNVEKAKAIENYFHREFVYNEEPDLIEGEGMMNDFLFEKKEGFCQQFATAMTLMLRAQNIPARFVNGFVVSQEEMDPMRIPEEIMRGNNMKDDPYKHVFDYNAHTWVEVYSPSIGWIQYEPTPGQNRIQFYDPVLFEHEEQESTTQEKTKVSVKQDYLLVLLVILGCSLIALVVVGLIRRERHLKKDMRRRLYIDYRLLLLYLEGMLLGKREDETLREYGDRIEGHLGLVSGDFKDFVESFELAFYNDTIADEGQLKEIENFLSEIKHITKRMNKSFNYSRLRMREFLLRHR